MPTNNDEKQADIDLYLKEVIKIEKRYLYGLEKTSVRKRREAIYKYLTKVLEDKEI